MAIVIREAATSEWDRLGPRIAAFEEDVRYPLGDDFFRIDHGSDYFAFFRRLGEPRYVIAEEGNDLVGVLAVVYRRVVDAWYACDLKVVPEHRGRHVARRLAAYFLEHGLRESEHGYAISMNPKDQPNRVVRLLTRLPLGLTVAQQLTLFSFDADAAKSAFPIVERHRGPIGLLSLIGVKDIVLASTHAPMPLVHLQHGIAAQADLNDAAPVPGQVYMLSTPSDDPLADDLRSLDIAASAEATILQRGMAEQDWSFILTSDI